MAKKTRTTAAAIKQKKEQLTQKKQRYSLPQ
jgi:hypothetical protein